MFFSPPFAVICRLCAGAGIKGTGACAVSQRPRPHSPYKRAVSDVGILLLGFGVGGGGATAGELFGSHAGWPGPPTVVSFSPRDPWPRLRVAATLDSGPGAGLRCSFCSVTGQAEERGEQGVPPCHVRSLSCPQRLVLSGRRKDKESLKVPPACLWVCMCVFFSKKQLTAPCICLFCSPLAFSG